MRGLITALRTLTALPFPGREAAQLGTSLPWFPIVGLLLGAALAAAGLAVDTLAPGGWPGGAALVVVVAYVLITGALHLDGIGDWADGTAGGFDRERTLAIMKDSHVGAFGVIAVALTLLARWVALVRLLDHGTLVWIVVAAIVARAVAVDLAVRLPYARPEPGTASPFVDGGRPLHRLAAWGTATVLVLALAGPAGLGALALGGLLAAALGWRWRRRIGGITGDLLGAAIELTELAVLWTAAAWAPVVGAAWAGWTATLKL